MILDIATLFPAMCESVLSESILGRARLAGKVEIVCHDIRAYSTDKHRRVDDTPYGGGYGMVMEPQPIYDCFRAVCALRGARPHVVYMTPKGTVFSQKRAMELTKLNNLFILCGHYEGVDQRILDEIVDEELSIGDYVLTGGELAALVVADAVGRLCEGVLTDESCYTDESHQGGLLEYPHYTRPPAWRGREVPPELKSGDHKRIAVWRRQRSLELTLARRPDMLLHAQLNKRDIEYISALKNPPPSEFTKQAPHIVRNG